MTTSPSEPADGTTSSRRTAPPAPRWVKVAGIAALTLIIASLILHLTGTGLGPGMHGGH
ncbi:hypothetical protein GCM10010469_02110 [Streptomyces labedae]|uniref:Uncharacterized protein n=1 Tax=Streptomyces labedae TaxID=285569 RepID=A0ABP6QQ46_9ACTN